MKKLIFLLLAVTTIPSFAQGDYNAQVKTLAGNGLGINTSGGYGGFKMAYGSIDGLNTLFIGGQGGWVINHQLVIGGGGMNFTSEERFDANLNSAYEFDGGYGGILIEYMLKPASLVHLSFPLLIGGGGIGYESANNTPDPVNGDAGFFVIQPGVELQLNVLPFMRIALGGSYLFTSNIDLRYGNNDQIAGTNLMRRPNASIAFKFGSF